MSTSSPNDFSAPIIEQFRANGGRVEEPFENTPLLLLHHIGARTGTERVNPGRLPGRREAVCHLRLQGGSTDQSRLVPQSTRPSRRDDRGRHRERERLFAAMAERSPNFAEYQRKTECLIPVIVLEPVN